MKKIILLFSIILAISFLSETKAQVNINVNINSQPAWGPTGYDNANYYYFPDLNVYFDVNNSLFYYLSSSKWVSNRYLPDKYSKYDLYNTYKVVVNESSPWNKNSTHKKEYSSLKKNKNQEVIKNSNDNRYSQSKNNTLAWVNTSNNKNSKKSDNNQISSDRSNKDRNKNGGDSNSRNDNSRTQSNQNNKNR